MELTRLLPLLASLQSLPRPVSPADPLPAPSLSLDRSYRVYLPGDQVNLTCSAPSNGLVSGYRFFLQNELQEPSIVPHPNAGARLELIAEKGRAGSYTCAYWRWESNGEISSGNSSSVSITVRDPPAAPTFALSPPHQLYLSGEFVQLACSPPTGNEAVTRFQFSKGGKRIFLPVVPLGSSYSDVRNLKLKPGDSGSYSCRYWIHPLGREIQSLESPPVTITVTRPPAAPTLSQSPLHQLYLSEESVQLTCSLPSGDVAITKFQFSKNGERIFPSGSSYSDVMNLTLWSWDSGSYTCQYWIHLSGREIQSVESPPVSISVRARPLVPKLTVSPPHGILLPGESVNLTCSVLSASTQSGIRFFRDGQIIDSRKLLEYWFHVSTSLLLSNVSKSEAGVYSCDYWKTESGREIPSKRSQPISIRVIDSLPQPSLTTNPPSGAVREGLPLLITCTAPRDAGERRFHFYKDGIKYVPGEAESEISTMEPGTRSMNISLLCIPWASLNNSKEFACGYEENVSGRWIPSPRSQTVTVTETGTSSPQTRDILLITGGILLLIAALAALICYCHRKKRVPKTLKSTERSEPAEQTRNLDPGHDSKGSNATGPGAEQMEQGSEVTYALLALSASQAHTTQPKNKAKPAEHEHVLYSEVVTTHTRKTAK
ncbi:Fc receptor-like protein 5 isoform X2 [Pelodiscus sinensis]|uniref:Fc receptor-like protein 5 isoform X2 n=1 Tax=Pelodiscus sinensis TaxID=13735 RepID=UPI003F6D4F91